MKQEIQRIEEARVSLELAKLAKAKGFNVPVRGQFTEYTQNTSYAKKGEVTFDAEYGWNSQIDELYGEMKHYKIYSRPTLEILKLWLIEYHNIFVTSTPTKSGFTNLQMKYDYAIYMNIKEDSDNFIDSMVDHQTVFDTYEQAMESGLIFALAKLDNV